MVAKLFPDQAKTGPEKQSCSYTYAYLINVKDTLTSLTVKTGQGVSNLSVKWIPLEIAFQDNI